MILLSLAATMLRLVPYDATAAALAAVLNKVPATPYLRVTREETSVRIEGCLTYAPSADTTKREWACNAAFRGTFTPPSVSWLQVPSPVASLTGGVEVSQVLDAYKLMLAQNHRMESFVACRLDAERKVSTVFFFDVLNSAHYVYVHFDDAGRAWIARKGRR
jgi:hypothetical protein